MISANLYLARVGALGNIGRFRSSDSTFFARGNRVILRTARGLEVGEILNTSNIPQAEKSESTTQLTEADGSVLRLMASEDELLWERLEKNRDDAFNACSKYIQTNELPVTLFDVEPLFDGSTIYFYFWGEPSTQLDSIISDLAEEYEAKAQIRQFTQTLTEGCGPDCGTKEGNCETCSTSCALSSYCTTSEA